MRPQQDEKVHILPYHSLRFELHPEVYDPAEDSFLLLDALSFRPTDTCLEIGTGCGLIALAAAERGCSVVCTDINPYAVRLTKRNIMRNKDLLRGSIMVRQGDLFSPVKKTELFATIVFNPPYLPTTKKERIGGWFDVATSGGRDGLAVTKRFIHGLSQHLTSSGQGFIVVSSRSPASVFTTCCTKEGFSAEVVGRQGFEDEALLVYRLTPTD